ncbi:glycosyltransferase family 4 protein [Actinosynnema sp. NPDC051121]
MGAVKVFGWSADQSGCGWYRMQMPLAELARRGYETHAAEVMPDEWLETSDVLIAQRICKPAPTTNWQQIARHPRRPLMVVELDDDLWQVPPSSRVAYEWFSKPGVQGNLRLNLRVADLVTVSTEPLAEVVRRINPNVVVIPNAVPAAMLDLPAPERVDERFVVGWGGSSTHVMDFAEIGPQLTRFLQRNPATVLHTLGGPRHAMREHMTWLKRLAAEQWRVTEWSDDVWDYYRAIGHFDVSTAPLVPHVFNESKSPIKALEAAARGVPMVASAVGPYPEFVRHGETGLLVREPHEWPRALRDLLLDESMRTEMGAAARLQARAHTIERRGDLWEQTLLSQLTNHRKAS